MIKSRQSKRDTIKVIELFAGVGGFRLGLEGFKGMSPSSGYTSPLKRDKVEYKVVWSNQWEPSAKTQHASDVYEKNWGSSSHNGNDIGGVETSDIPDHDLLVGGFPCQDYSVATTLKNSKGLIGRKGVLWWQIERILREKGKKAPKYLLLENVDRLLGSPASQRGRDFAFEEKRGHFQDTLQFPPARSKVGITKYDKWTSEEILIRSFDILDRLYEGVLKNNFTWSDVERDTED